MTLLTGFELIFSFLCAGFLSLGIVGLAALIQEIIMKMID